MFLRMNARVLWLSARWDTAESPETTHAREGMIWASAESLRECGQFQAHLKSTSSRSHNKPRDDPVGVHEPSSRA